MVPEPAHAAHFESLDRQAHAARLGMWVFLSSELLLFAGLLALYAGYRAHYPAAFSDAVAHNPRVLGTANTVLLLTSSWLVALAVESLRRGFRARVVGLLSGAIALGAIFLGVKSWEYREHFHHGIWPGGRGAYFAGGHALHGQAVFYTLYYLVTGLHAVHVVVGMTVLVVLAVSVARGRVTAQRPHPLENGALYWHLVDCIWILLWPLFYLLRAA